jgi:hypothetical protein
VDFGLSRILEMFEQRFGPKAAAALVALAALALAAVCLKTIVDDLIVPLYLLVGQLGTGKGMASLQSLLAYLTSQGEQSTLKLVASTIPLWLAVWAFLSMRAYYRAHVLEMAEAKKSLDEGAAAAILAQKLIAETREAIREIRALRARWDRVVLDAESRATNPPAASPPSPMPPTSPPEK